MLLHENQLVEKTTDFKQPIPMKKNGKDPSTKVNISCFDKENKVPLNQNQRNQDVECGCYNPDKRRVNNLDDTKMKLTASRNGHGKAGSVRSMPAKSNLHESNIIDGKSLSNGSGPNYHESSKGGANRHHDMPSSGRKFQDRSCILLAEDAESRAKVEEQKEVLKNEASIILKSCGWYDEVYNFMRAKKRKCTNKVGKASVHTSHLRNLLIAEAKPSFIAAIPESLKGNLISQLRSFINEKG